MPKKEIRLSVRVFYKQPKASELLDDDPPGWIQVLTSDLSAMKLPYPKRDNVMLVAPGCLEFFWDTHINSPLYDMLYNRLVHSPTDDHARKLKSLSIRRVSLKDLSVRPSPVPYLQSRQPIPSALLEGYPIDYLFPLQVKTEAVESILPIPPGRESSIASSLYSMPSLHQTMVTQPGGVSTTPSNSEITLTGLAHTDAEATTTDLPTNRPNLKRAASVDISPLDRRPPNPGNAQVQTLIQELKSVRETITGNLSRENAIIQELSSCDSPIPPPQAP
ncbi:hypothetical protein BD779DRAFT_1804128 [Infundibulicybe gibba]|nr:hypothetical protein BD779DRAFT_1804128 [Infundibulicybe gibba]